MKGYPRKTCKKAKAASLSIFDDSEDSSGVLCEGVGAETCYPPTRVRRHARSYCGDLDHGQQSPQNDIGPTQVGDTFIGEKLEATLEEAAKSLEKALNESLLQEQKKMIAEVNRLKPSDAFPHSDRTSRRSGLWERVRSRLRRGTSCLVPRMRRDNKSQSFRNLRAGGPCPNCRTMGISIGLSGGDRH